MSILSIDHLVSTTRLTAAATLLVLASAGAAFAQEAASPEPGASAATDDMASPAPETSPLTFPLPEIVAVIPEDIPTVSLEPESTAPGAEVGVPMPFTLQHCGLLSPIDIDGSFWVPVGGVDASGGPIDSDDEIGELINATAGELLLTSADAATFTTPLGSQVHLVRAAGAVDFPLCM